jgi:hypothetical protein
MNTNKLKRGGMAGAAGVGGAFLAGPVLGPAVAGYAVDNFTDMAGPYTEAGIAMSIAGLALGSQSSAGSNAGVM